MNVEVVASTYERLKEAFSKTSFKQADLVKMTGIDKSSISLYLSGKVTPKGDKLYKLALALGVSPVWLAGFNVPMIDSSSNTYNVTDEEKSIPHLVSEKIRHYRTQAEMSVKELAEAIDVSEDEINKLENTYFSSIDTKQLLKISKALNVDIIKLLPDEPNSTRKLADPGIPFKVQSLTHDEKLLLNNYNTLNQKGKKKLIDYSDDLVGNIKYTEKQKNKNTPKF